LKFALKGKKLKGEFVLVRLKKAAANSWLLIKHRDEFAVDEDYNSEDLVPATVKKKGLKK
jgi:bifunctional non-homologous end joining protein LigD